MRTNNSVHPQDVGHRMGIDCMYNLSLHSQVIRCWNGIASFISLRAHAPYRSIRTNIGNATLSMGNDKVLRICLNVCHAATFPRSTSSRNKLRVARSESTISRSLDIGTCYRLLYYLVSI